ncbi:hypothetical protein [Falsirhodobacter halotolerans]|uniref:hypothetical protein n=1 Tax=Falsirhodobacter halotolerans TaxID=1146892 RepID=UPI001FD20030|nr:hypothetical protein [Falsirhodobacter halotolerans]MCJ8139941.1 hypothetical protein [Falsirhodobacter halotolerans]
MTDTASPITLAAGIIVAAQNQTVAEVSGSSHQSGVLGYSANGTGMTVGGGGSGHVTTSVVNVEKGSLERYADGYEISYDLRMAPFLRLGEDAALIYAGERCIGAAKLRTGQWRTEDLDFGAIQGIKVMDSTIRVGSFIGLFAFPALTGNYLLSLACIAAFIASVYVGRGKKKEAYEANRAAITAEVAKVREQWADRIGQRDVPMGEIRASA